MLELEMMIAGDMEDSESKMEQDNEEAERERREKEEKVGHMRAAASMFYFVSFCRPSKPFYKAALPLNLLEKLLLVTHCWTPSRYVAANVVAMTRTPR